MASPPICIRFDHLARAAIRARGPACLARTVAMLGAELRLAAEAPPAEAPAAAPGSHRAWSVLDAAAWSEDAVDLVSLDEQVARRAGAARGAEPPVRILIRAARRPPGRRLTGHRLLGVARQVVTRYQRFFRSRNAASAVPAFDRALVLHERLHDRRKPLVAADYDHALDTWRWVLRLAPGASFAVQVAALFHDVERLDTEADARVEHLAPDYVAFKAAHAASGARRVAELLARIDVSRDDGRRICDLVEHHEGGRAGRAVAPAPGRDDECRLLAEADALSFFSLNASGFLNYYGAAHTAHKVAYSLGRLGPAGRRELRRLKVPAAVQSMLARLEGSRPFQPDEPEEEDRANDGNETSQTDSRLTMGDRAEPGASRRTAPRDQRSAASDASLGPGPVPAAQGRSS